MQTLILGREAALPPTHVGHHAYRHLGARGVGLARPVPEALKEDGGLEHLVVGGLFEQHLVVHLLLLLPLAPLLLLLLLASA